MNEKRITDRLTKYWDILKKDESMPPFQKFNASAIDDVWGNCILLTVNNQGSDEPSYTFYRMGDKVKKLYSKDMTGQNIRSGQYKSVNGAGIIKRVGEILNNPQPVNDNGQFVNNKNKIVKFRSCMLPFGQKDQVTHVIVGLSWREFG